MQEKPVKLLPMTGGHGWPWTETMHTADYDPSLKYPKITIITPVLNQGKYIEAAIRSVLLQNYPHLEYIIMDGGSSDNTLSIIKKYTPWIHHWESIRDHGQSHAINKGLKLATGEIITWLNGDDLLTRGALKAVAEFYLRHPQAVFTYGKAFYLLEESTLLPVSPPENPGLQAFSRFPFVQPSCFFKKAVLSHIGLLDESLQMTMDFDLFVRIALLYDMKPLATPLAMMRKHAYAKTSDYNTRWDEERKIVFSTLLRTVGVDKMLLTSLQGIGYYLPSQTIYHSIRSFTEAEVHQMVADFIWDTIRLNYKHKKGYRDIVLSARWLLTHLPEFTPSPVRRILWTSRFYQYWPALHRWRSG